MNPSNRRPMHFFSFGGTDSGAEHLGPRWLWHGYLAAGQLTLLTSLWKSGKTTLLWLLLTRMKTGGELLGRVVRPGKAVVLSEENLLLWQMRHRQAPLAEHVQLVCGPFQAKPTHAQWQAAVAEAGRLLGADGDRLLVIDTVATLMPTGVESNTDCMVRGLAPLRTLAEQGVAVWLMHHPRKGREQTGHWPRGTGSLPSTVDIALEMHYLGPADPADRRRLLVGLSRFEETPRRRIVEWHKDGLDYQVLPETTDTEFDRGWQLLRRVLAAADGPQPATAILRAWPADAAPPSRATLQRWLARAVERNLVCCEVSPRRNAPYLYWLPASEAG